MRAGDRSTKWRTQLRRRDGHKEHTMTGDISSLSVPLWIMAGLSILEALLLIAMGVGGYLVYARVTTLLKDLETRQIAPLRERVDAILDDVQTVTSRVAH